MEKIENLSYRRGFSKEILELNKRKNGPIFGIDDNYSVSFPNVNFDIYSQAYWKKIIQNY